MVFVLDKELFGQVLIKGAELDFLFNIFNAPVMNLKNVVERVVAIRVLEEWHLVWWIDVFDDWVLADFEQGLHNN